MYILRTPYSVHVGAAPSMKRVTVVVCILGRAVFHIYLDSGLAEVEFVAL